MVGVCEKILKQQGEGGNGGVRALGANVIDERRLFMTATPTKTTTTVQSRR